MQLPQGFRAALWRGGIKKDQKTDLSLIVSDRPAAAAGVFNKTSGCSTVQVSRRPVQRLHSGDRGQFRQRQRLHGRAGLPTPSA